MDCINSICVFNSWNHWMSTVLSSETVKKISAYVPDCLKKQLFSYVKNNKWISLAIVLGGVILTSCILKIRNLNRQLATQTQELLISKNSSDCLAQLVQLLNAEVKNLETSLACPLLEIENKVSRKSGLPEKTLEDFLSSESSESLIQKSNEFANYAIKAIEQEVASFENWTEPTSSEWEALRKENLDLKGRLEAAGLRNGELSLVAEEAFYLLNKTTSFTDALVEGGSPLPVSDSTGRMSPSFTSGYVPSTGDH